MEFKFDADSAIDPGTAIIYTRSALSELVSTVLNGEDLDAVVTRLLSEKRIVVVRNIGVPEVPR